MLGRFLGNKPISLGLALRCRASGGELASCGRRCSVRSSRSETRQTCSVPTCNGSLCNVPLRTVLYLLYFLCLPIPLVFSAPPSLLRKTCNLQRFQRVTLCPVTLRFQNLQPFLLCSRWSTVTSHFLVISSDSTLPRFDKFLNLWYCYCRNGSKALYHRPPAIPTDSPHPAHCSSHCYLP
jgi:hypothetical protein